MPSRRNLRSWWDRTKKRMGLEDDQDFVFHTCRHTRATRMVDAGINIFVIKEWMGHKRIETTLRYAHVKQQNLEDALDQVGEYFAKLDGKSRKSAGPDVPRSEEHTSELQSLMRISYAVFCLKKNKYTHNNYSHNSPTTTSTNSHTHESKAITTHS